MLILISGPCGAGKTSVADELSRLLGCRIVEVDDVKRERYGTTEKSAPGDFTEAGRRARDVLAEDGRAIVVEAFGEEHWVELVRRELPDNTVVRNVYLWCDEGEAIRRKAGTLSPGVVRHQFRRFPGPSFSGRISIDTTSRNPMAVAGIISQLLLERPSD